MRSAPWLRMGLLTMGLSLGLVTPVAADHHEGMAEADQAALTVEQESYDYMDGAMRKLGRGFSNVFTGLLEIPVRVKEVSNEQGYLAGWTTGTLQGAWRALVREAVGAFEVVTFMAEVPEGFEPLVEPEYLFVHTGWTRREVSDE